jgi:fructokinase
MTKKCYGAVELGGTKFTTLIARDTRTIIKKKVFPTLNPADSLQDIISFFKDEIPDCETKLEAIGVGSFGPLDINPESNTFGFITSTPKQGWEFYNIKGEIEKALDVKVFLETDVNAAAVGEFYLYPANRIRNLVYITIGTGIGAGIITNGKLIHGLVHPEFGHICIPHDARKDPFKGVCPYHGDCFEGLASGPAMTARWNLSPDELPVNHVGWELEGEYITYALANLIYTVSPEIIILGGGVMRHRHLFPIIHNKTRNLLRKYIKARSLEENISDYIVPPRLKDDSGILGALSMAVYETKTRV